MKEQIIKDYPDLEYIFTHDAYGDVYLPNELFFDEILRGRCYEEMGPRNSGTKHLKMTSQSSGRAYLQKLRAKIIFIHFVKLPDMYSPFAFYQNYPLFWLCVGVYAADGCPKSQVANFAMKSEYNHETFIQLCQCMGFEVPKANEMSMVVLRRKVQKGVT